MTIFKNDVDVDDCKAYWYSRGYNYGDKIAHDLVAAKGIEWTGVQFRLQDADAYRQCLEALIANGIEALRSKNTTCWVVIRMDRNQWDDIKDLYHRSNYKPTLAIIRALQDSGYIEYEHGNNVLHKCSRYCLTEKFLGLLAEKVPEYADLPILDTSWGTCAVKDPATKKIIKVDKRIGKRLEAINDFLLQQNITVAGEPYMNLHYKAVHYKGYGGRIYNAFQGLPALTRATAIINGEQVAELDLNACHLSLLYNEKCIEMPEGDLYDIGANAGLTRNVLKVAALIMINTASRDAAIKALCEDLFKDPNCDKILDRYSQYQSGIPSRLPPYSRPHNGLDEVKTAEKTENEQNEKTGNFRVYLLDDLRNNLPEKDRKKDCKIVAEAHIQSVEHQHKAVSSLFYRKDKCLELQGIEGALALSVLDQCLSQGIPVLNVHDAFYCQVGRADEVECIIKAELARMGLSVRLKRK